MKVSRGRVTGARALSLTVNPLFAFSFLEAFLETLRDYLGETTETSIKDNFDIVYMVRSHLCEARR